MTSRRAFLGSLLAASALPRATWADAGNPAYIAAAQDRDGAFALYGLGTDGTDRFRVALPARGHAAATHPTAPEAVAFARRPGTYALVLECSSGSVLSRLTPPDGHDFNGHGTFSRDGDTLYTSEVRRETGEGRVGLWSRADGYRRTGDIASGGIGPHDIRRLPGSETLVVANGGIHTDGADRIKLNLDTMAPNLTYLDPRGGILQQITPDHPQTSIRHLAVSAAGTVAFALQWEGDGESPALLGLHVPGQANPVWAKAPGGLHDQMQGYAGSVCFFADGGKVAISSPKGGLVQVFGSDASFAHAIARGDVCGLAAHGQDLVLTDGFGTFVVTRNGHPQAHHRADRAWDNHLIAIPS